MSRAFVWEPSRRGRQKMLDQPVIDAKLDGAGRAVGAEQKALEAIDAFAREISETT